MAERTKTTAPATRPVPMKLFASWEVDCTAPNCIPRLCSLTLTRLMILRPLGSHLTSIVISVKMQSSKRTMRSNEMAIPASGLLDTELDLQFALQYPHYLKRDDNKLVIQLQRRKRYKNRTMLGYKTLAEGVINMAQILQQQMDLELVLMSDKVEKYGGHSVVLARVFVVGLSSQPVDQDKRPSERLSHEDSDEEEEFSSEGEAEGGSDSEPAPEMRHRRKNRAKIPPTARQRNLKQKFMALLKRRFRTSEDLDQDQEEIGQKLSGAEIEIEELFDELENYSDLDSMSVSSTPKPSLRPFFSSSRSLLAPPVPVVTNEETGSTAATAIDQQSAGQPAKEKQHVGHTTPERGVDRHSDDSSRRADSDSHPENWTDHEAYDPPQYGESSSDRRSRLFIRDRGVPVIYRSKKRSLCMDLKPSTDLSSEPRKALLEQLSRVLPDDNLPDALSLVSLTDPGAAILVARLQEANHRVVSTASPADIRATFTCLITRIQKFCDTSAKPPTPVKVVIAGCDGYVNAVLRHYVEQLDFRPLNYLKFFIVPLGFNTLSTYLGSIDAKYSLLFDEQWKGMLELEEDGASEAAARVSEYLTSADTTLLLPIAEAMVTYREAEDSSHIFIPFINDVRVGCPDYIPCTSVELEDSNVTLSGSPPSLPPPILSAPLPGRLTPPSSPNVNQAIRESWEPVELQIDYWSRPTHCEKGKNTLRQAFRALRVQRLPPLGESPGYDLSMYYSTKEKKQKIMLPGKKKEKEKDIEPKSQIIEHITRLLCSAKTHNVPLKVTIDGTEWYGVKFFQLSRQWQTHIKTFPIALLEYDAQQHASCST